jgi:hypothetical protein
MFIMKKIFTVFVIISIFISTKAQTFTVEQHVTGQNNLTDIRGQSFIPSIQGEGSGEVGTRDSVYLNSFAIVYAYSATSEADTLYIYSEIPDSVKHLDDGSQGTLIGKSTSKELDGIHTVYSFENTLVHKDRLYYAVFREDINPEANVGSNYNGGSTLRNLADTIHTNDYLDLRFIASFSIIIGNETDITDFEVSEQIGDCIIDKENHTITAEVDKSATWNLLLTTITLSPGARYSPNTNYFNYSEGPVTVTVVAEDGVTTQDWEITVNKNPNNETDIFYLWIAGQIGDYEINTLNHTVHAKVEKNTVLEDLSVSLGLSYGATYQPNGSTFDLSEGSVVFTILAEDGTTTQDWELFISKDPNDETDILKCRVWDQAGMTVYDTSNHSVYVLVEKGTDLSNLMTNIEVSYRAVIEPGSGIETDFTSGSKTYSILAEDSITMQDWTVYVSMDDNSIMADTNLVAYYTFENQVLIDESGNGHHGYVYGPTFTADSGIRGGCFSFDSAYGDVSLFNYQPSGSTSFNIWVKPFDSTNSHRIFHKGRRGGTSHQLWSYSLLYYKGYFRFSIANPEGTGAVNLYSDSTQIPENWYMVTCTFDDVTNLAKLYIDGQLMAQDISANDILQTSEDLRLSNYPNPPNLQWIDGYVDEFSIWQKELSKEEIEYLYLNRALPMSSKAEIKTFSHRDQTEEAMIDSENQRIELTLRSGTDINMLKPDIVVSPGATIYPFSGSPINFSSGPVTYTVTAEDIVTFQEWSVEVDTKEIISSPKNLDDKKAFNIFPNPCKTQIHIKSNNNISDYFNVRIISMDSRVIYQEAYFSDEITLDLNDLKNGIYIIQINEKKGAAFHKTIVVNH